MKKFFQDNWWKILLLIAVILIDINIWHKSIENYFHGNQAMATILGYIINTAVIFGAMVSIDYQNKERWQKDSLQKKKNESIIKTIIAMANCLQFIYARDILKNSNTIGFDYEDYDKNFKNVHDSLTELSIFYYSSKDIQYEKMTEVMEMSKICCCLFYIINEYFNVKKGRFIQINELIIEIRSKIDSKYFNDKQYEECFNSFGKNCNYDFGKLIDTFYVTTDEIYTELLEECGLQNLRQTNQK